MNAFSAFRRHPRRFALFGVSAFFGDISAFSATSLTISAFRRLISAFRRHAFRRHLFISFGVSATSLTISAFRRHAFRRHLRFSLFGVLEATQNGEMMWRWGPFKTKSTGPCTRTVPVVLVPVKARPGRLPSHSPCSPRSSLAPVITPSAQRWCTLPRARAADAPPDCSPAAMRQAPRRTAPAGPARSLSRRGY